MIMTRTLSLLALSLGLASSSSFASLVEVPAGYEPVLDCKAANGAPDFTVAKGDSTQEGEKQTYFLAASIAGATKMIELYFDDGDGGTSNMKPLHKSELGDLTDHVRTVYVNTDAEDIEDPNEAEITSGLITNKNYDDQYCVAITRTEKGRKVYPSAATL
jgi:hypothetical protein